MGLSGSQEPIDASPNQSTRQPTQPIPLPFPSFPSVCQLLRATQLGARSRPWRKTSRWQEAYRLRMFGALHVTRRFHTPGGVVQALVTRAALGAQHKGPKNRRILAPSRWFPRSWAHARRRGGGPNLKRGNSQREKTPIEPKPRDSHRAHPTRHQSQSAPQRAQPSAPRLRATMISGEQLALSTRKPLTLSGDCEVASGHQDLLGPYLRSAFGP